MKQNIRLFAISVALGAAMALSACSNSPAESDARKVVESTLAGCKYLELRDFQKVNGIPGETGNGYRVDVKYTIRLSPDSDIRANARAIASRDLHSKHSSPIVLIESGLEPLVLYADLGGFVSAQ